MYHSDVVGASPVGATPTTSSLSTEHLVSIDSATTTARRGDKHLSYGIWCNFYKRFDGTRTDDSLAHRRILFVAQSPSIDIQNYDAIKWKHFLCYCSFVRGIHWPPVDSPHKGTIMRTLDVSLLFDWTNCWANAQMTGNSTHHDGHLTSP